MRITHQPLGAHHLKLTVWIDPPDYLPKVENELRSLSKKISVPGFRPGKVPVAITRKLYGNSVLVETLNRLVSEQISAFLKHQQLDVFGEPLPLNNGEQAINIEAPIAYVFDFEIGLRPSMQLPDPGQATFVRKHIQITQAMVDREVERLRQRYGRRIRPDQAEPTDVLVGIFEELDDSSQPRPDGVRSSASFRLQDVKDPQLAQSLAALQVNESVTLYLPSAFGADREFLLHRLLQLDHEQEAVLERPFRFTLSDLIRIEKAELNQDFFDRVFGQGRVTSIEQMRELLRADLEKDFAETTQSRLQADVRDFLIEHTGMELPEAYIRRLLNERRQAEEPALSDEHFAVALRQVKWEFIMSELAHRHQLQVSEDELQLEARREVLQYLGIPADYFVSEPERLQRLIDSVLSRKETRQRLHTRCLNRKVIEWFLQQASVADQLVAEEEFFYH
ncbi:MAG: trigger factor [Chitinophagales bacterium]|nr:trigger factor [Chitinophagales bacterium]MDW8428495.1 trigger factor [Chitinophagales bacterium]